MTDVLLDPNDSGEVTRIDGLGAEPTEDLRHHMNRRDTTGELTQNLGQYARPDAPFGYLRKTFDIDDTVVYRRDTVVYDQPPTVGIVRDLAGPQKPPPPLPKPPKADPAETGVNIFGGLGEHLPEGELPPRRGGSVPYVMPDNRAPWTGARHAASAPAWTKWAIGAGTLLLVCAAALAVIL